MSMLVTMRHFDGFIRVNFPALQQAVGDIDNTVSAMNTTLTDLDGRLQSKLAEWDGGAYGSYEQTKLMWMTAAQNISNLLFEIRDAVNASNEQMFMTEMRNASRLQRG
jgi:early secretory antigenic target protein ESAT-6